MSQPIRGWGGHFVFPIGGKNTYLVEDLASCQLSLNSVQQFQRRSRKCLSQSEARAAILFSDQPEKHKLGRGRWDLASCHRSAWAAILFSGYREVENVSANQRPGRPSCFPISPKNTNLVEDVEILLPVTDRPGRQFYSAVTEKSKMSQPIRGWGGHLVFPISPKNTN